MIRPQPIDLSPWPLGGLLVPDVPGGRALAEAAVAGTSVDLTEEVTFWAHAAGDDVDAALQGLDALAGALETGAERRIVEYDRFVLRPTADELERLRGEFTGVLAELLEVAAFRCGLRGDLPEFEHLDGELLAAARAGVQIDLIVRGICILRPGVPGLSENIRVRSIVGRFLEHSRIYSFHNDGDEVLLLSSADWMERNFFRRVEVAFPVRRKSHVERVKNDLQLYLDDSAEAWALQSDGSYERVPTPDGAEPVGAQSTLLARYSAPL